MLCVLLTSAAWILAIGLLLTTVCLISDRLFGRPRWTPDCYRADRERSR